MAAAVEAGRLMEARMGLLLTAEQGGVSAGSPVKLPIIMGQVYTQDVVGLVAHPLTVEVETAEDMIQRVEMVLEGLAAVVVVVRAARAGLITTAEMVGMATQQLNSSIQTQSF